MQVWRTLRFIIRVGCVWGILLAANTAWAKDTRPVVLLVVAPVAYHEGELKSIQDVFKAKNARCVIGSTQSGEAKGMVQGTIRVDVTLDQIQSDQVDGLVIVGGSGAKMYLWFNPDLKRLVRGLNKKHRPIGAVSIAPAALVYAGILKGRKASVLPAPETKKLFERNGVEMAGADTTMDANVVTTATSSGAAAVALAVAQQLPRKSRATPLETAVSMPTVKPKPTVALPGRKPRKTE